MGNGDTELQTVNSIRCWKRSYLSGMLVQGILWKTRRFPKENYLLLFQVNIFRSLPQFTWKADSGLKRKKTKYYSLTQQSKTHFKTTAKQQKSKPWKTNSPRFQFSQKTKCSGKLSHTNILFAQKELKFKLISRYSSCKNKTKKPKLQNPKQENGISTMRAHKNPRKKNRQRLHL